MQFEGPLTQHCTWRSRCCKAYVRAAASRSPMMCPSVEMRKRLRWGKWRSRRSHRTRAAKRSALSSMPRSETLIVIVAALCSWASVVLPSTRSVLPQSVLTSPTCTYHCSSERSSASSSRTPLPTCTMPCTQVHVCISALTAVHAESKCSCTCCSLVFAQSSRCASWQQCRCPNTHCRSCCEIHINHIAHLTNRAQLTR